MNRNWILGCLSAAIILGTGISIAFYFLVVKPMGAMKSDAGQLATLAAFNDRLVNKGPYAPPAGGLLTADQVRRFVAVQAAMKDSLGPDLALLADRALKLREIHQRDANRKFSFKEMREAVSIFVGIGPPMRRAKELQVSALNAQGFSKDEYRWVREHVYMALGQPNHFMYPEDQAGPGPPAAPAGTPEEAGPVPPVNGELVAPLRASLDDWLPFMMFGL